jgi:hypothetical protein
MPPPAKRVVRDELGCFRGTLANPGSMPLISSLQILGGTEEEDKRARIEVRHFHRSRSLFYMSPELMPHRGQNPIGKIRVAA